MDEMPKRIWACENGQWIAEWFNPPLGAQYVCADLAQAPAPVRVKPLVWVCTDWSAGDGVEGENDCAWEAFDCPYIYTVDWCGGDQFLVYLHDKSVTETSLQAAKAAAQADYEARILAALEGPDAAPVRVRDFEIARLAREIGEIGRDLGWHRVYDRANAILAALEAPDIGIPISPDAGVVAELVEAAKALKAIVEEIRGAMEHGTWRDGKGQRLKDTPEWVAFYNALALIAHNITEG